MKKKDLSPQKAEITSAVLQIQQECDDTHLMCGVSGNFEEKYQLYVSMNHQMIYELLFKDKKVLPAGYEVILSTMKHNLNTGRKKLSTSRVIKPIEPALYIFKDELVEAGWDEITSHTNCQRPVKQDGIKLS